MPMCNGGCAGVGELYQNLLGKTANHGIIVLAKGSPTGGADLQTKPILMNSVNQMGYQGWPKGQVWGARGIENCVFGVEISN
jgi:hypothetical protein